MLSLPLSFVRMLGTIIALQVVDSRGRRSILLKTLPILTVTMMLMGMFVALYEFTDDDAWFQLPAKWATLSFMIVFLFSYAIGMEFIPWLVNSEIYPLFLIGSASALSAFSHWITCFMMSIIFKSTRVITMVEVAAFFNFLSYLFVRYFVAETRGNTIIKNVALMLKKSQREVT